MDIDRITPGDNSRACATMADAFEHDPFFSWLLPDDSSRRRRLAGFFAHYARHVTLKLNETWATEDFNAIAMWLPPDTWKVSATQQLRMLPGFLRWGRTSTPRMMRAFTKMEHEHPAEPAWYLLGLGTSTSHQGKGLGSALLNHMLERVDEQGLPAYLESSNPRNIPLYARHGFEEREPVDLGPDAPVVTPMWRKAR